ncbi:hypothetical protein MKX01_027995, partial [Papaver californicum]
FEENNSASFANNMDLLQVLESKLLYAAATKAVMEKCFTLLGIAHLSNDI